MTHDHFIQTCSTWKEARVKVQDQQFRMMDGSQTKNGSFGVFLSADIQCKMHEGQLNIVDLFFTSTLPQTTDQMNTFETIKLRR